MTPNNHHMTVTDQHGKQVRSKVVYLQPKTERWQPQTATVHIVTSDWLDPYGYTAIYNTPAQSIAGRFVVYAYSAPNNQDWLFKSSFQRAQDGEMVAGE